MPDVAPKNQTEERFEPDYVHRITFGNPPRNSLPAQLVNEHEWKSLLSGTDRFEGLKRTIEMTNTELYAYLRLGVSTQSASHLKWMGYETPESLVESPVTAPLLPDHLARHTGIYPIKFIDACEQEGVSAVVCQLALRRGITEKHLEGALSLGDLLYAFTNLVNKTVTNSEGGDTQPSVINYVCDGTIPLDFVKGAALATPSVLAVVKLVLLSEEDKELADVLLSDIDIFRKFVRNVGHGRSLASSVDGLRTAISHNGFKVLSMDHPLLCSHRIGEGENKFAYGYEAAKYTEALMKSSPSSSAHEDLHYSGYGNDIRFTRKSASSSWFESVRIPYTDIYDLFQAGVEPAVAYKHVIEDDMPAASLIAAYKDGVQTSLMSGAL
jgi:hypothetical protein